MNTEIAEINDLVPRWADSRPRYPGLRAWLKRHPLPVSAFFDRSLVLTYALPVATLAPLLPPALSLDTCRGFGFVAIAMVQTRALRPSFLPRCLGRDFFLSGYRIFARYKSNTGHTLRGLRILRSDTNRKLMAFFGNCLTHYNYRLANVDCRADPEQLEIRIQTKHAEADLRVLADLKTEPAAPPAGSPFADLHEARLFAGPLPFTFDYEEQTNSLVLIEGVRRVWRPRPIKVQVRECTFFEHGPFQNTTPVLANAFLVEQIPYHWKRGKLERLV